MKYHKNKNCGDRKNHCVISSYICSRNAREKIKESFTYSQVVTKEVKVCKGKGWQKNRGLNTGIRETAKELHIKECMNDKTEWKGLQLLITPKGKETFKLLYLAAL